MTTVVDASVVVAALIDSGDDGAWALDLLARPNLAAPHLLPVECANVLRRAAVLGDVSEDVAAQAHADVLAMKVELFEYRLVAPRVWELRSNLSAYDACYIALAEGLHAPLATLDRRLQRAAGPRCEFIVPV